MKALTIKAPWAQAIVFGTKRIENRTWKPHADVMGQRIAIHCGRSLARAEDYSDHAASSQLRTAARLEMFAASFGSPTCNLGHIIGTARVVGWIEIETESTTEHRTHNKASNRWPDPTAAGNAYVDPTADEWWLGPIGWLLDDVRAVEPVAVRGQVGLWTVPDEIKLIEVEQ